MLPRQHRLSQSADLRQVFRRGRRFSYDFVVIHAQFRSDNQPSRLGVVTPKLVGNAVARNRVARQIRHGFLPVLARYPRNLDLAVRALAGSAGHSTAEFEELMSAATERLVAAGR